MNQVAVRKEAQAVAVQEVSRGPDRYAQLALFTLFDKSKTNMAALYDLAPRFVFDTVASGNERPRVVEREFTGVGGRYRITLKPTQVKSDGKFVFRYLGEREQIVEEVIRRLATERGRLRVVAEEKVRFHFSLHEVRSELARVGHTYNLEEIKEAILLLNEVRITIEDIGNPGQTMLSAAAFPVVAMRRRTSKGSLDGETFVEFNPLIVESIKAATHRQVDYDLLMRLADPMSRWLLKWLYATVETASKPVIRTRATDILRDSGAPEWKQFRNLLRKVSGAVEALKDAGILDYVEVEDVKEGSRKVDLVFTMSASPGFMAEVRRSTRIGRESQADLASISGGNGSLRRMMPLDDGGFLRITERRRLEAVPMDAEDEE